MNADLASIFTVPLDLRVEIMGCEGFGKFHKAGDVT